MNCYWITKLILILNLKKSGSKFTRFCCLIILCSMSSCLQATELPNGISSSSETYHVTTNSMNPNISSGNMLIIDTDAYQNQLPTQGDIVVFIHPKNPDNTLFKRIIGLPQEKIEINNQTIWIDEQELEEAYIQEPARYSGKWIMDEQEYFVLSDDRNNGSDSHNWGGLPFENIIGKVTHICDDDSLSTCQEIEEDG